MAKDYKTKGKVLIMQEDGWIQLSTIVENASSGGSSGQCTQEWLRSCGEHQARLLHCKKIGFGDYQTLNGFYYDSKNSIIVYDESKKVDARTFSSINFTILNEMMRLTAQRKLEEMAA